MVTEDHEHAHTEEESTPIEEKDSNLLCSELVVHIDDIFDVIKNGYVLNEKKITKLIEINL